ncbi:MAG: isocitrate lyase/PEP mutase family protein [Alphaproteobacteria bacterium]|nr:isocitrate lyase/PEP mutase family protein [Alphaproteobacteria bacterium]
MERPTAILRKLLKEQSMLYLPAVYYPLGGRMMQAMGFDAVYVGGYVTGASRATTEPLLTMTEQIETAELVARSVSVPTVCDAGAGFGEPLHVTRTVRDFIHAGVAGIHIEDQLYPKRAHYHKYVAHAIDRTEFVDKIRWACRERDKLDPDFVVIARSDTCRFEGLDEAVARINLAAAEGADMGLIFPRDDAEAARAPKESDIPLVYVQSRGNRDGRPVYGLKVLEDMGYAACIDAQLFLLVAFHHVQKAMQEIKETGDYSGMSHEDNVATRQAIEDLIDLESHYAIEEDTVESERWGKR